MGLALEPGEDKRRPKQSPHQSWSFPPGVNINQLRIFFFFPTQNLKQRKRTHTAERLGLPGEEAVGARQPPSLMHML